MRLDNVHSQLTDFAPFAQSETAQFFSVQIMLFLIRITSTTGSERTMLRRV